MKITPALMLLREALAKAFLVCAHQELPAEQALDIYWKHGRQQPWLEMADQAMADGHPLADALQRIRREAFESGSSPSLSVLLFELESALPGPYQDGLARAVVLLSQEMGQHYGAVFEAGVRIGRAQAKAAAGGDGGDAGAQ